MWSLKAMLLFWVVGTCDEEAVHFGIGQVQDKTTHHVFSVTQSPQGVITYKLLWVFSMQMPNISALGHPSGLKSAV